MTSLLYKELRSLRPFLALLLFLILLSAVYLFLSEYPDQYPLSKLIEYDEGEQVMTFVMAFALASGLLVRERDEGTLAFLDALPISRARIFACKVLLGLAVLWLLPLSDLILKAGVHAWARTSLERRFEWQLLFMGAGLDAAACFVYFSIGLALSFMRRFSLLVLGLAVCAYLLLQEIRTPGISLFNIFTLSDPVFQGQHWLLPTAKLATQLALGGGALAIAFGAFLATGETAQRLADQAKRRRRPMVMAALGTTVLVLVWAGLAVYWIEKSDLWDKPKVHYTDWSLGRIKTSRYTFVYPQNEAGLVGKLAERADSAEARVREFLGESPISRIEADLTGSAPRTGGQAHWNKVQMDLASSGSDIGNLIAILAHETTHVYIEQGSQAHISDDFNSTRFFHEGLATYVEYHLFRHPASLAALLRVAAVMRARDEVKLEELLDDQALTTKRDSDLVYPLGEAFVSALVKRYGDAAPGHVIRSFARPNAPTNLKGFALWQDVLQASGYNLSDVENAFFTELDKAVSDHRAFIESLPRIRGAVQRDPVKLVIRARYAGDAPGILICRFRARADTPPRLYEEVFAEPDDPFWVDGTSYTERSFWYQLGWRVRGASQPIYEPWVEALRER
jgi:ABC-type transport system involved in multi-copper enzyme maturation permease subunit